MATMKAKKTAIIFLFFMLCDKFSLAVIKDKWRVVGLGSLPNAEAESQWLARCRSAPVRMFRFTKAHRQMKVKLTCYRAKAGTSRNRVVPSR
jgi:hypothetical protein